MAAGGTFLFGTGKFSFPHIRLVEGAGGNCAQPTLSPCRWEGLVRNICIQNFLQPGTSNLNAPSHEAETLYPKPYRLLSNQGTQTNSASIKHSTLKELLGPSNARSKQTYGQRHQAIMPVNAGTADCDLSFHCELRVS